MAAKATTPLTPKALAAEIGISPKVLRAHLRRNYKRDDAAKNTSWVIPAKVATEVRAAFKKNEAK